MKVLLAFKFQSNFSLVGMEPLGMIQLGRLLKDRGHEVDYAFIARDSLTRAIREFSPAVIGYSISSTDYRSAVRINRELKSSHRFFSVFGGPHPTFFPEMIEDEGVDAVCVGEADVSFPEFIDRLEAGEGFERTPNFWVKSDSGGIARNDPAPLVEDLDTFPFGDREGLYQVDRWAGRYRMKSAIASRGCPFHCTYCFNRSFRKLYQGLGRTFRTRSPEHLVEELALIKRRWPLAQLCMVDDCFGTSRPWLERFTELYRRQVDLPFVCFIRIDQIDDDKARLLHEAGCFLVFTAVESGDERIRREVLKRPMSDDQIRDGAELLKRHQIKFFTQNMMAVPGESFPDALKTLDLNLQVRPDLAITSLFAPFPKLELTEHAVSSGCYSGDPRDLPPNMTNRSVLNLPDIKKIERLQKLFPIIVDFPALRPYAELLASLPLHPLYSAMRKTWMGFKSYRNFQFKFSIKDQLGILIKGLKFVIRDR